MLRFSPVTYVLIHGGGSTARFWDRLLPYLDQPALAVDLPGRNGKPADFGTLTVDDEVASVIADVDAAELADPIVVVAHSSGGLVVPGCRRGPRRPRRRTSCSAPRSCPPKARAASTA